MDGGGARNDGSTLPAPREIERFGVTTNVTTAGFKATSSGNSDIDAQIALLEECIAPIVSVIAGSEDKWFAVTGVSSE